MSTRQRRLTTGGKDRGTDVLRVPCRQRVFYKQLTYFSLQSFFLTVYYYKLFITEIF